MPERELQGVRGWLLLFVVALTIVSPLLNAWGTVVDLGAAAGQYGFFEDLRSFVRLSIALRVAIGLLGIGAGVMLWRGHAVGVRLAKVWLWAYLAVGLETWLIVWQADVSAWDPADPAFIRGLLSPIVVFAVWYAYLARSKRVRNTYGELAPAFGIPRATRIGDALGVGNGRMVWSAGLGFLLGTLLTYAAFGPLLELFFSLGESQIAGPVLMEPERHLPAVISALLQAGVVAYVLGRAWPEAKVIGSWVLGMVVVSTIHALWAGFPVSLGSLVNATVYPLAFIVALVAAIRWLGVSLLSVVGGPMVATVLVAGGYALVRGGFAWEATAAGVILDLVSGAFLYAGFALEAATAPPPAEPGDAREALPPSMPPAEDLTASATAAAARLSQRAGSLSCPHCGASCAAERWPANGDHVAFYNQTAARTEEEPGEFKVSVHCASCSETWFVVWDRDPT